MGWKGNYMAWKELSKGILLYGKGIERNMVLNGNHNEKAIIMALERELWWCREGITKHRKGIERERYGMGRELYGIERKLYGLEREL